MSKLCTFFIAALVFNFMLCHAARPDPTLPLTQHLACLFFSPFCPRLPYLQGFLYTFGFINSGFGLMQGVEAESMDVDGNCEGVGKEECLMRRTLAAHVDYIYTQHHHP
ncbi:hypothetical protein V6N13_001543 [Hibiscus sabdariffa]|uniref:Phytosulfokine n=1 Tax=Hibiscus sabdariffa TaxID=183260 RepID=A0ABR2GA28_9ROSI